MIDCYRRPIPVGEVVSYATLDSKVSLQGTATGLAPDGRRILIERHPARTRTDIVDPIYVIRDYE